MYSLYDILIKYYVNLYPSVLSVKRFPCSEKSLPFFYAIEGFLLIVLEYATEDNKWHARELNNLFVKIILLSECLFGWWSL
jgi:hypothetical protein